MSRSRGVAPGVLSRSRGVPGALSRSRGVAPGAPSRPPGAASRPPGEFGSRGLVRGGVAPSRAPPLRPGRGACSIFDEPGARSPSGAIGFRASTERPPGVVPGVDSGRPEGGFSPRGERGGVSGFCGVAPGSRLGGFSPRGERGGASGFRGVSGPRGAAPAPGVVGGVLGRGRGVSALRGGGSALLGGAAPAPRGAGRGDSVRGAGAGLEGAGAGFDGAGAGAAGPGAGAAGPGLPPPPPWFAAGGFPPPRPPRPGFPPPGRSGCCAKATEADASNAAAIQFRVNILIAMGLLKGFSRHLSAGTAAGVSAPGSLQQR